MERSVDYAGYLTVERLRIKTGNGTVVPLDIKAHGDNQARIVYGKLVTLILAFRLRRP